MEITEDVANKTEPLHTTIHIMKESFGGKTGSVEIGNTGLRFVPIEKDGGTKWVQHYTPDGYDPLVLGSSSSKPHKYSLIYALGIEATIDALNSGGVPSLEQPLQIIGETVSTMNKVRENLFGRYYASRWAFQDEAPDGELLNYYKYTLDINGLRQDEKTIARIHKLAEKCRQENYKMKVV